MRILKKTAVAAAVTMAVGSAQAALVLGTNGPGEMFLNVWDQANNISYALDLGVTVDSIYNNPAQALTFDLSKDSNYTSFLNNTSLIWNIAGADEDSNNNLLTSFGVYGTSNAPGAAALPSYWDYTYPANSAGAVDSHGQALNAFWTNPNVNGTGNGSGTAVPGDGNAYFGAASWSYSFGGSLPFDTTGTIDAPIHFWHWGSDSNGMATSTQLTNDWTLTSGGTLCYGGTACGMSAVPVPAAVWLFGSGLVGLVGVARRKMAV